jgi:pyruvate ferredoxin oxidoreductase gamma subunit
MREMLLVGRGGEGVVIASQILAETLARAGFCVQSFPEFKAERRGAPISAFLRWDTEPIHRRFKLRTCDVLVDISVAPPSPQVLTSVRPGGLVLVNSESRFAHSGPFEVARVPAARIAQRNGILSSEGRPMGNMAVLGACVKLIAPDALAFLEEAIRARMGSHGPANAAAARDGYAACTRQHARAGDEPVQPPADVKAAVRRALFAVSTADSLRVHTGAWSLDRPVLLEPCNYCALCALFCPEGAMTRTDGAMAIDYLYCKGCGICEVVCPVKGAIAMEAVPA